MVNNGLVERVSEWAIECVFVCVLSAQGRFLSALSVSNDDSTSIRERRVFNFNFWLNFYCIKKKKWCFWGFLNSYVVAVWSCPCVVFCSIFYWFGLAWRRTGRDQYWVCIAFYAKSVSFLSFYCFYISGIVWFLLCLG